MSHQPHNTDIAPALLEALVCPLTREELIYKRDKQQLCGKRSQRVYAIKSGIPIMIPDKP